MLQYFTRTNKCAAFSVNVPLSAFEHGGGALWPSCGKAQEGLHPLTHIICECMLRLGFPSQRPVHRVRESGNERCVCVCACIHPQMKALAVYTVDF